MVASGVGVLRLHRVLVAVPSAPPTTTHMISAISRMPLVWLLSLLLLLSLAAAPAPAPATPTPTGTKPKPSLTLHERDLLCATRQFLTPKSKLQSLVERGEDGRDAACVGSGFWDRWRQLFKGRVELGVGEGMRAQVFVSNAAVKEEEHMIIAFKHFEHERDDWGITRDWYQEAMVFGLGWARDEAAFLGRAPGGKTVAAVADAVVRGTMKTLALDYHHWACRFVDEVIEHARGKRKITHFTGFDQGGMYAALQVARLTSTTGVVFGAPGLADVLEAYGYGPTKRVYNLALEGDTVPFVRGRLGSRVCVVPSALTSDLSSGTTNGTADEGELSSAMFGVHERSVFDATNGMLRAVGERSCVEVDSQQSSGSSAEKRRGGF